MHVVPTLSLAGWVKTPEERIDRIILYYTATNPSQTLRYNGHVVSLQYAFFRAGESMEELAQIVSRDLTAIFSRNFPEGATVEVEAVPIDGEDSALYNLEIAITVQVDNKIYNAAQTLSRINSEYVRTQQVTIIRS